LLSIATGAQATEDGKLRSGTKTEAFRRPLPFRCICRSAAAPRSSTPRAPARAGAERSASALAHVADALDGLEVRILRPEDRPVRPGGGKHYRVGQRQRVCQADVNGAEGEIRIQIDDEPLTHLCDRHEGIVFSALL